LDFHIHAKELQMLKNAPPDPAANLEAEMRADDEGMPEPPEKVAHPRAWARELEEREKLHAAGYPVNPVGRAGMDVLHSLSRLAGDLRPPRRVTAAAAIAGIGLGLAAYFLLFRDWRYR
jgi:hypothetical protein